MGSFVVRFKWAIRVANSPAVKVGGRGQSSTATIRSPEVSASKIGQRSYGSYGQGERGGGSGEGWRRRGEIGGVGGGKDLGVSFDERRFGYIC